MQQGLHRGSAEKVSATVPASLGSIHPNWRYSFMQSAAPHDFSWIVSLPIVPCAMKSDWVGIAECTVGPMLRVRDLSPLSFRSHYLEGTIVASTCHIWNCLKFSKGLTCSRKQLALSNTHTNLFPWAMLWPSMHTHIALGLVSHSRPHWCLPDIIPFVCFVFKSWLDVKTIPDTQMLMICCTIQMLFWS